MAVLGWVTAFPRTAAVVGLACLVGCSGASRPYSPTRGQVLVGGQPAEGALVTLVPLDGTADRGVRPSGLVAADGSFALATFEASTREAYEGAPPGQYAVLVTWYPQASLGDPDHSAPQTDRLGGRYRDPATSPLRAEVKATATELPPIVLSKSDARSRSRSSAASPLRH